MNLAHPEQNTKLARMVGQHLEDMRREAGISARELSLRISKHHLFFIGIEDGEEPLYLADFIALVLALGEDPTTTLRQIVD